MADAGMLSLTVGFHDTETDPSCRRDAVEKAVRGTERTTESNALSCPGVMLPRLMPECAVAGPDQYSNEDLVIVLYVPPPAVVKSENETVAVMPDTTPRMAVFVIVTVPSWAVIVEEPVAAEPRLTLPGALMDMLACAAGIPAQKARTLDAKIAFRRNPVTSNPTVVPRPWFPEGPVGRPRPRFRAAGGITRSRR